MIVTLVCARANPIPDRRRPITATYWIAVGIFVIASMAYLFMATGLSPQLLNFSDVYEQRAEYKQASTALSAYVTGTVGAGVLPALTAASLYYKNRLLAASALVGVFALYSVTGYKSYIVGYGLTVTAFILVRRGRSAISWILAIGSVMVGTYVVDRFVGSIGLTSLFTRRGITTAGVNTSLFFDFFGQNPHYELRHSVLSFMGPSPYDYPPALTIGQVYYHSSSVSANANMIADGYANFGIFGCLLMAIVLGLYLRTFDRASAGLPLAIPSASLTLVLMAVANTAMLTVLVTHGALILLLLIYGMPRLAGPTRELATRHRRQREQ